MIKWMCMKTCLWWRIKIVQMNVMLLSNYRQANYWCQKCCTWCRCHQMHWRLNMMSGLLHLIVKRPDARWRLSVDEVVRVASDADTIKCTDGCLIVRRLHPTVEKMVRYADGCLIVCYQAVGHADCWMLAFFRVWRRSPRFFFWLFTSWNNRVLLIWLSHFLTVDRAK